MTVVSDREQEIQTLMAQIEQDARRSSELLPRQNVEIAGEKKTLSVYRMPISDLRYNIRNGRFAAELRWKEAALGRALDSNDLDDAAIIRDLLLNQSEDETKILKEDLMLKGQIDPGLITFDGNVINGNRRMAIFQSLHDEDPQPQWEYLDIQVLPKGISAKDLWRIEAGLQLSRDKRLDYEPINELLKLREGIEANLTPEEIAALYYGKRSKKYVEDGLKRLALIEMYLEFIGKPEHYHLASRKVEHFINIQKNEATLTKEGYAKADLTKIYPVVFNLILSDETHLGIRKLGQVFKNTRAWERATRTPLEVEPESSGAEIVEEEENDLDVDSIPTSRASQEAVRTDEADPNLAKLKQQALRLRESYRSAVDIVDYEKERERPLKLVERAITVLETIDMESDHFRLEDVLQAIVKLEELVNQLKQVLVS